MATNAVLDKRTDDQPIRRQRHIEPVPADWARLGRDEHILEGYSRFVAEKVCYEYRLERDPHAVGGHVERHLLFVAYRQPETDEVIERSYQASVAETDAGSLSVPTSERDGDLGPDDWGRIDYQAIEPTDSIAVIPKCVRSGEPRNFRASVAVQSSEPRIVGEE
ncbi:hypothetical protein [Natrialba asiatica]|uniref:Uncharacterized protein n=1 Tax=Natrialba asiatica (strain ATCC 700177 / DSM 12278 / JCM 9576 / FERM P-10747 / NBRC 102637 / 172P1) TaxID=29540 RepID=M0AIC2_NATA1|nr:hypothetical protein [Natrialba asiatica]ELY97128.1 hypothetical protein C481_21106 [Natrialba asiatica DSM 12278]